MFQSLDGDVLAKALGEFARGTGEPGHSAIDGKTLKGSRRLDAKAPHVLSAFATQLSCVIGDLTVAPDQNEITGALAGRSRRSHRRRDGKDSLNDPGSTGRLSGAVAQTVAIEAAIPRVLRTAELAAIFCRPPPRRTMRPAPRECRLA